MNRIIAVFSLSIFAALGLGYFAGKHITELRYRNIEVVGDRLIDAAYTARTLKYLNEGNTGATKDWLNQRLAGQVFDLHQLLESAPDERSRRHVLQMIAGMANVSKSAPLKAAYPEAQAELDRAQKEAVEAMEAGKTFK